MSQRYDYGFMERVGVGARERPAKVQTSLSSLLLARL